VPNTRAGNRSRAADHTTMLACISRRDAYIKCAMSEIKADGLFYAVRPSGLFVVGVLCLFVFAGLSAQTVYKTVDESGHATYSTSPPPDGVAAEVMIVEPAPLPGFVPPPTRKSAAEPGTAPAMPQVREVQYADMSLEELDAGCETAREARIAPIRTRETAQCKASRTDPDICDRYYQDLGEPRANPDGTLSPRMFDDLPECKLAEDERLRRAEPNPGER